MPDPYRRLQEMTCATRLPWNIVEKDYLLSWLLAGIAEEPTLSTTLVFKGGTALKKGYFDDYRFSEDLDFTASDSLPAGEDLYPLIDSACRNAERLLDPHMKASILWEVYRERDPHPFDQVAFTIRAKFPWQREPLTKVMIEISRDEVLVRPPELRPILHPNGEDIQHKIMTYSLEEIVVEKLRAILQHAVKLHERGWTRSRARDYYDLWRIFGARPDLVRMDGFASCLEKKCASKAITMPTADDFFEESVLKYVESTWDQWLGGLVSELPPFESVVGDLRAHLGALFDMTTLSTNNS